MGGESGRIVKNKTIAAEIVVVSIQKKSPGARDPEIFL